MRFPTHRWQDLFNADQLATEYVSGGDTPSTWAVSGGILSGTSGVAATLLKTALTLSDCEITVNSDQAQDGGIIARHVDNSNYYVLTLSDDSGAFPTENLRLSRRVAGVFTQITSADVTWVRGTSRNIRFTLHGSRLEVWFESVRVISVVDATFSSGSVGLRNNHTTAFRALDFTVHQAQQAIMGEEGVTNLLTAGASQLSSNTNSNNTGISTISFVAGAGRGGRGALRSINVANGANMGFFISPGTLVAATAGLAYNTTLYVQTTLTNRRIRIFQSYLNAGGGTIRDDGFTSDVLLPDTWTRLTISSTAPTDTAFIRAAAVESGSTSVIGDIFWFADLQIEQRAYSTTWQIGGTPRVAENLTIPSANTFNRGNWTVEGVFTPQILMNVGNVTKTLFDLTINVDNHYRLTVGTTGEWRFVVRSGGVDNIITSATNAVVFNLPYHWQITGDGTTMRICVNGAQVGELTYAEPVGTLPVSMLINTVSNGLLSNLRFSNRARTLAEHQTTFNAGQTLTVDADTTYLLRLNNSLAATYGRVLASTSKTVATGGLSTTNHSDHQVLDTGWVYSNAISYDIAGLLNNFNYKIECHVVNQRDQSVASSKRPFTTNYAMPEDIPELDIITDNRVGTVTLDWINVQQRLGVPTGGYQFVGGVYGQAVYLLPGTTIRYFNEPLPLDFTNILYIKLPSNFAGKFITKGSQFEIGYDGTRFYYKNDWRITAGKAMALPTGFFKVGIKQNEIIIVANTGTDIIV